MEPQSNDVIVHAGVFMQGGHHPGTNLCFNMIVNGFANANDQGRKEIIRTNIALCKTMYGSSFFRRGNDWEEEWVKIKDDPLTVQAMYKILNIIFPMP
jgi:hypothetical protein